MRAVTIDNPFVWSAIEGVGGKQMMPCEIQAGFTRDVRDG